MSFSIDEDVLLFLTGHLGRSTEEAYEKCSGFAYRDMCRTIDFNADFKETKDNKPQHHQIIENKNFRKNQVTDSIRKMVEELLRQKPLTADVYDKYFYQTCDNIISIFDGTTEHPGNSLCFGQAQKWVNMTMKNLYVYSKSKPECELDLEPLLPFMHVPIDNYILDIVCGNKPKMCWIDSGAVTYGLTRPETAWSLWDVAAYQAFRDELNRCICKNFQQIPPLRWELRHWSTVEK